MENIKEKLSCDLWFTLPDMKVTLKATVWNASEKLMFVKVHVLKKNYVVKLFSGIHRYFVKQQKIGILY